MKRSIKIIALLLVVTLTSVAVAFVFAGCDLKRKLSGAEVNFPTKVSDAKALTFDMVINYKKGDDTTVINLYCYKTTTDDGEVEYAYDYSNPNTLTGVSYRNLYADTKLYEIANIGYHTGSYYVRDDVSIDDEGNILYHVTNNITYLTAAALLVKAKKETMNGEQVYRYDVELNGNNFSIWYNSEVLVQIYAKFAGENDESAEEYTVALSNYKFDEEISASVFARPEDLDGVYVESPISFESWVEILNHFSKKLGSIAK